MAATETVAATETETVAATETVADAATAGAAPEPTESEHSSGATAALETDDEGDTSGAPRKHKRASSHADQPLKRGKKKAKRNGERAPKRASTNRPDAEPEPDPDAAAAAGLLLGQPPTPAEPEWTRKHSNTDAFARAFQTLPDDKPDNDDK